MRAVWVEALVPSATYHLTGEPHHHLVNVVRIEVGDDVLLLNGKGLTVLAKVTAVSKKEIQLAGMKHDELARPYEMDLALGIPKREALELALKQATELGFRRIYLVRGAYSQQRIPEADRLQKLLVSALEQSNAAYLPEVVEADWGEIPWDEYGLKLLLDSQTPGVTRVAPDLGRPTLLVVGPEGGFDSAELSLLHETPGLEALHLPTPILRTPTAVAAGAGCLLQRLIDRR